MGLGSLQSLPQTAGALGGLVLSLPSILGLNNPVVGIQPQAAPLSPGITPQANPDALIFNYEGEQTITLESDITDHYIEDNTAINDQIALRPELITTHGFIGELNNILPSSLQALQTAAQAVSVISGYTPSLSITALLALNKAEQAYQTGNQLSNLAVNAFNTITGAGTQNKQQKAFGQIYGWWQNRTLMTVQTPWNLFINCAIKTARIIQDPDTQLITDFEVTFKVLRFASTVIGIGIPLGQGYTNGYFGQNSPTNVGTSLLTNNGPSLSSSVGSLQ
jgi:hypothetical protein